MFKKSIVVISSLVLLSSCSFFKPIDEKTPLARVNDSYLYEDDINALVADGISEEDSTFIVNGFINRWATQLLLVDGAERNLSEAQQDNYQRLVDQYKKDLYTKAYLEALVNKTVDTVISNEEAQEIYEANKETFKLNEELLRFRYITIPNNAINESEIKERFKRFDEDDKRYLDSISVQFKSYSLNDSIWIQTSQIVNKIPAVNSKNKKELLKKSNFVQLKDSLDLYLVQIKDVLFQNDIAPLDYVKPTVDQIIINKRKLELINKLETDITKDAIKNKQFEIYK
ncbi:peptidyl-prolyl cis-trans isomerase [Psychroserpens sp.]|uniref:peptidyl-prolyl cis-trans isomerase n=1 Tax=Psychroserpens sp. TaxID=2020870 RepID=UPI00385963AA